jgi:hypothetical protein
MRPRACCRSSIRRFPEASTSGSCTRASTVRPLSLYAPCRLSDLEGAGFDYWALGHAQSLKALDELRVALNVCAGLEDCIATMECDRRLFADEVAAVAPALDSPDDVRRRAQAIERRLARAHENARPRREGQRD